MSIFASVTELLAPAFEAEGLPSSYASCEWSDRPEIADFTCKGALKGARTVGLPPLDLAQRIIDRVQNEEFAFSIAGKGYINAVAKPGYFGRLLDQPSRGEMNIISKTYVIDYGGPNIAKPMHVGHLRSLVIGESLKRILRSKGHFVISDIHWGDWGLQMGLLIALIQLRGLDAEALTFDDLGVLYPEASALAKEDAAFRTKAQKAVMFLQTGQGEEVEIWKTLIRITESVLIPQIKDLGVDFDLWHGESHVAPAVNKMIDAMVEHGVAVEDDGAVVIPLSSDLPPLILRNSEGAVLYGATDYATLEERFGHDPDEIIYVVDQRQALHFKQLFTASMLSCPTNIKLQHVGFGTVNGEDGRPLKTRDGGVPLLSDLIDSAVEKAMERNADPDVARKVALAAIKFADLSNNRLTNYVFDLDNFLAFEGKTGPYLCYQHVRMERLLKQASVGIVEGISTPGEKALAIQVLKLPEMIDLAISKMAPNVIAEYAYNLAQTFSAFYAEAPIASSPVRMGLVLHASKTLGSCLHLLGIEPPDEM